MNEKRSCIIVNDDLLISNIEHFDHPFSKSDHNVLSFCPYVHNRKLAKQIISINLI